MSQRLTPARRYAPGIGQAVADRTINRTVERTYKRIQHREIKVPHADNISLDDAVALEAKVRGWLYDGYSVVKESDEFIEVSVRVTAEQRKETWAEVADRVALGNSLLDPRGEEYQIAELQAARHHLRRATILSSGRHLQHGDERQPVRNMEVFTNCATSAASFMSFYLLLNGSGVGRSYDDDMMVVDWSMMPLVVPVIDHSHPDVESGEINTLTAKEAKHLYENLDCVEFEVPDSREGWAQAIEMMELMAYESARNHVLILDFSRVRERGQPIGGMQGRPASGPGPLMEAVKKINRVRDAGMEPWRSAMFVDHYLAECVLVGGARRAARMSTKTWRDRNVLDFVRLKKEGFLWSSNNSVTADETFWRFVNYGDDKYDDANLAMHAREVAKNVVEAGYHHGSGEPGIINQHRLARNDEGIVDYIEEHKFFGGGRYELFYGTARLICDLAERASQAPQSMITNPCGEIPLFMLGGFCVIGDLAPYHAKSIDEFEDAARTMTRMLIRVNLMDSIYINEVKRTNRIGVSLTGIHEFAFDKFGFTWHDLIDEERSKPFWMALARVKRAVDDEAVSYSGELGVEIPHTNTTIKPAGTTSKLFSLSEGAHLPAKREYMRWVQFRNDDPLVEVYKARGYPVRELKTYSGTTIVGFPTQPEICKLGMGDKLVTAYEATPEEQYQWLRLLEKYWIDGVDENGDPLITGTGNQVSYTLKINPGEVDFESYRSTLFQNQSTIKCCSVMLEGDDLASVHEYTPEEAVTKREFEQIVENLVHVEESEVQEDVSAEHVDCANGACPVDFGTNDEKVNVA